MVNKTSLKSDVQEFWNKSSCGEIYAVGEEEKYYESESIMRYKLEPYIFDFAKFNEGRNRDVLEVGVGMGTDHIEWAKSTPKSQTGVDLTERAVEHTKKVLFFHDFKSDVKVADAENLPFDDDSFDIVYSYGVLHHSPDTSKAFNEVYRVLRPGGIARVMIYHKYSLTGYMLWFRYGLLAGHPFKSLDSIYFDYLESPGTKAYTVKEAKKMCSSFSNLNINTQLSFGDLLEGGVGQRHRGILLSVAKYLWPRKLIKILFKKHGLLLFIEAKK